MSEENSSASWPEALLAALRGNTRGDATTTTTVVATTTTSASASASATTTLLLSLRACQSSQDRELLKEMAIQLVRALDDEEDAAAGDEDAGDDRVHEPLRQDDATAKKSSSNNKLRLVDRIAEALRATAKREVMRTKRTTAAAAAAAAASDDDDDDDNSTATTRATSRTNDDIPSASSTTTSKKTTTTTDTIGAVARLHAARSPRGSKPIDAIPRRAIVIRPGASVGRSLVGPTTISTDFIGGSKARTVTPRRGHPVASLMRVANRGHRQVVSLAILASSKKKVNVTILLSLSSRRLVAKNVVANENESIQNNQHHKKATMELY